MFNGGQDKPAIEHLRTQTPRAGTPDATPHEKSEIFPAGTPILPRPLLSQCVPHRAGGWGHPRDGQLDRACLSTTFLFRRRSNKNSERDVLRHDAHPSGVEPLTNAHSFEVSLSTMCPVSKTELRAAQPNLHRGRIFAHACKSRRAPRPRKPDGKLSRHGLGARRVALLAPRGVLNRYRHPLSYVGAITKILVKSQSKSRILGDVNSIPSGGGVP